MRIATWNVNGLRARLDFIRIWLERRQPDIVGLQEIKVEADDFPRADFSDLGYEVVLHGEKGWNGVAVLSRLPIEDSFRGLPGQEEMGARLVGARIGGLTFVTVYCPNGKTLEHEDFGRKLVWLDELAAFWSARDVGEGVLCGDFNIVPQPIDSWHGEDAEGKIFHTAEERQRFDAFRQSGLVDLFRDRNRDARAFSWWDYRGGAFRFGHGLRIDFLLATPSVSARVVQVEIDRDFRKKQEGLTASDHAPVIADLDWG